MNVTKVGKKSYRNIGQQNSVLNDPTTRRLNVDLKRRYTKIMSFIDRYVHHTCTHICDQCLDTIHGNVIEKRVIQLYQLRLRSSTRSYFGMSLRSILRVITKQDSDTVRTLLLVMKPSPGQKSLFYVTIEKKFPLISVFSTLLQKLGALDPRAKNWQKKF